LTLIATLCILFGHTAKSMEYFLCTDIDYREPKNVYLPPLSDASKKLFDAITQLDSKGAESALKNGADVNAYNDCGRTPFGWLVTQSSFKENTHKSDDAYTIAQLLLQKKELDINKDDGVLYDTEPV